MLLHYNEQGLSSTFLYTLVRTKDLVQIVYKFVSMMQVWKTCLMRQKNNGE